MIRPWPRVDEDLPQVAPVAAPERWVPLIGEYSEEHSPLYVFEHAGVMCLQHEHERGRTVTLAERTTDAFIDDDGRRVRFLRDDRGTVTGVVIGGHTYGRRVVGPEPGSAQMRILPVAPVLDVIRAARLEMPPAEAGVFRADELVDVAELDPSLHLDLRYASTNNFLSETFYDAARALLQRPVADAVARVHQSLRASGLGLTVFDAYRPWYVTKAFWDATPDAQRWMVATPANSSKHNRGAAVDVTLHDLRTGAPVDMPSTFDEPTTRAYAFYPGGTSRQRWHRACLRQAMEAEGFLLNLYEWWHFDHPDWRAYRIGNASIADLVGQQG